MAVQTVTLTLPETLYERARETAKAVGRSLDQVLVQSVALSLPHLEADLPPEIRSELLNLSLSSDDTLWTVAHSTMDENQQRRLEALADAQKRRTLRAEEQAELTDLLEAANRTMLRKAEAYRLLARRGYEVFAPNTTAKP
jgi:biopolymer transport protein ExbD